MKTILAVIATLMATPTQAQQYRNYEVRPDGAGGYYGTDGNRNFQVSPPNGGRIVRTPNGSQKQYDRRPGDVRSNRNNCVVDGNGNAFCR